MFDQKLPKKASKIDETWIMRKEDFLTLSNAFKNSSVGFLNCVLVSLLIAPTKL
jgi:hypothetical protein